MRRKKTGREKERKSGKKHQGRVTDLETLEVNERQKEREQQEND